LNWYWRYAGDLPSLHLDTVKTEGFLIYGNSGDNTNEAWASITHSQKLLTSTQILLVFSS
jgi:hypothetical protein